MKKSLSGAVLAVAMVAGASAPASAGDLNSDGMDEIVVAVPGDDDGIGSVTTIFSDNQPTGLLQIGTGGLPGSPSTEDFFGSSVATGDLNGDGRDDLAVGSGDDVVRGVAAAGSVLVVYSGPNGPRAKGARYITRATKGIPGAVQEDDAFGETIAIGNFGGGPEDDLVIGIPSADVKGVTDAGAVVILYGSPRGVGRPQFLTQATPKVKGDLGTFTYFGEALAAGDVMRNKRDDLIIGARSQMVAGVRSGAVTVLAGGKDGLVVKGNRLLTQVSIGASNEANDSFGGSVAVGNFGGNGKGDLAVGAKLDGASGVAQSGSVFVLLSSGKRGLSTQNAQTWHQGVAGVSGIPESLDWFGAALAGGDLQGDKYDELVIGVPQEDFSATDDGYVHVLPGSVTGLTTAGSQAWSQDTAGVQDNGQDNDKFGSALALGNYGGAAPGLDLVIGVPGEEVAAEPAAGAVTILLNDGNGLSDIGNQFLYQGLIGMPGVPEANDRYGSALA